MLKDERLINVDELLAKAQKPSTDAMELHLFYRGKVETAVKCTVRDFNDFAIWLYPGRGCAVPGYHRGPGESV